MSSDGLGLSLRLRSSSTSSTSSLTEKPALAEWVSKWEIRQVESSLHIYYNDECSENVSDVVEKLPIITELTEEQLAYANKIKEYLQKITLDVASTDSIKFHPEQIMDVLEEISNRLEKDQATNVYIRHRVMKFVTELTRLAEKIKNSRAMKVYEGSYTGFFAAFADMCCLQPVFSFGKEDQSVWKNLRGIKKVISTPYIRLYKYGMTVKSAIRTEKTPVAVVEVKNDSGKLFDVEWLTERLDSTQLSNESSLSDDSSYDGEENRPNLERYLDRKILGKHAGELLLELYEFHRFQESQKLTMPGMIVDGTKVYFTLLEISKNHFRKLEMNGDIDPSDRATIFYSKPFNILNMFERSTLIDNFIRLNNIEYKY